jgi:hypothetical protein
MVAQMTVLLHIFLQKKKRNLYSSVPYNVTEMKSILDELEVQLIEDSILNSDDIVQPRDVVWSSFY